MLDIITIAMSLGVVVFIGRWLYKKFYLSQFVLKNLDDINSAFSALVKHYGKLNDYFEKLRKFSSEVTTVQMKQADVIRDLEKRINDLEEKLHNRL